VNEHFARLFVDAVQDLWLLTCVAEATKGSIEASTVRAGELAFDVRENPYAGDGPSEAAPRDGGPDAFFAFPLVIEAFAPPTVPPDAFDGAIAEIMLRIAWDGVRVVAATDREPALPGGGRLGFGLWRWQCDVGRA
jgi:hypothetical protein